MPAPLPGTVSSRITRTDFLRGWLGALCAAALGAPARAQNPGAKMHTRPIPSSGAMLPVIGCGTWRSFDVGQSASDRAPLAEVLRVLFDAGGSVIDSSPMYGRAAERRLLPLAADRGIAVLVNQPFGGGGLLRGLRNKPLPEWASEIECRSWAQILLKYVLGHPAVTCAIPGTGRPEHMQENARAGFGTVPDAAFRGKMLASLRL